MNANHSDVSGVSIGAFIGAGPFLHMIEPALADLSYLLAAVAAVVTIYYKIKKKGQ